MDKELTFPEAFRAVAAAVPDAVCLVHRSVRRTFSELDGSVNRAAAVFASAGAGAERRRAELSGWESGQGHVALMLRNCPEIVVAMLGASVARAVSFNVNFRYTADELVEIFEDTRPLVVVVHDEFADTAHQAISRTTGVNLVLQVPNDTEGRLLPGAVRWSDAMDGARPETARTGWSPDDLYMLFTGGTTGKPKGVLWRQADALAAAFNVVRRDGSPFESLDALAAAARDRRHQRVVLAAPPLIHGASQWVALGALLAGGRIVIQDDVSSLNPSSILSTIEAEAVTELLIVGDAFGKPLADELESCARPLPSLRAILNGGAALSPRTRDRLLGAVPGVRVVDSIGSSESGRQATRQFSVTGSRAQMEPLEGNVVLSEDRSRLLGPDEHEVGWLARSGRVPLGYLNDRAKTERTFPVIDGIRYVVPGDRARNLTGGKVEVLGRDSTTINTGGEKVFGEEVEAALVGHPGVRDALVLGQPSERWGEEVVALLVTDGSVEREGLIAHTAQHLARYKLPGRFVFVPEIPRTPAGKADYRAAQALLNSNRTK